MGRAYMPFNMQIQKSFRDGSGGRGWRDYFVYHIRGLKFFKGRVSKPLQPPEPGHHMYLVDINTAALHGFMISSIKLPLHLFQRFCQRGSIYTSYVVIHSICTYLSTTAAIENMTHPSISFKSPEFTMSHRRPYIMQI